MRNQRGEHCAVLGPTDGLAVEVEGRQPVAHDFSRENRVIRYGRDFSRGHLEDREQAGRKAERAEARAKRFAPKPHSPAEGDLGQREQPDECRYIEQFLRGKEADAKQHPCREGEGRSAIRSQ